MGDKKQFWSLRLPIIAVILLGFLLTLLRLPLLDEPFIGSHLFRQLQTMSTIEAYVMDGVNLLYPRTNYMGYPGHLLLEFPIFQAIAATLSKGMQIEPLILTKSLNFLIGLFTCCIIYRTAKLFMSFEASIVAGFLFFIAPLNLQYHCSTLIDPLAVLTAVISTSLFLDFFLGMKKTGFLRFFTFLITSIITVLIKPLYLFPLALLLILDLVLLAARNKPSRWLRKLGTVRILFWALTVASGLTLICWLGLSAKMSSAQDVASHLGWKVLRTPSFYVTTALRYLFYIQSPIVLFLSIIGVIWAWSKNFKVKLSILVFAALPFTYYLTFANINRPHDYYSLILIPFISITAAAGFQQLSNWLKESDQRNISSLVLIPTLGLILLSNGFLYLSNYWISPNTTNRYAQFSETAKNYLEPYEYSLVFIDRKGPFSIGEYLGESRRDMIAAVFDSLNEAEIRNRITPVYAPAVLYSLNHQYGEMNWYSRTFDQHQISVKKEAYEGKLKYLVVLMPSKPKQSKLMLADYPLVAETNEMLIFDISSEI